MPTSSNDVLRWGLLPWEARRAHGVSKRHPQYTGSFRFPRLLTQPGVAAILFRGACEQKHRRPKPQGKLALPNFLCITSSLCLTFGRVLEPQSNKPPSSKAERAVTTELPQEPTGRASNTRHWSTASRWAPPRCRSGPCKGISRRGQGAMRWAAPATAQSAGSPCTRTHPCLSTHTKYLPFWKIPAHHFLKPL